MLIGLLTQRHALPGAFDVTSPLSVRGYARKRFSLCQVRYSGLGK